LYSICMGPILLLDIYVHFMIFFSNVVLLLLSIICV